MERAPQTYVQLCGHLVVELRGCRLEQRLPSRQGRILFAYLVLEQPRDGRARSRVRVRVLDGESGGEQPQLGAGLIDRDARAQPPDHAQLRRTGQERTVYLRAVADDQRVSSGTRVPQVRVAVDGTAGRPVRCRLFQVQNRRKPRRCHARTVSGLTM